MQYSFQAISMALAFLSRACHAHWRLTKPVPRVGDGVYENNPLPPDANTKEDWVCRHPQANPSVQRPTLIAGATFHIKYGGGATIGHAGDCSVYISYDTGLARRTMRWVKIANLPDCREQINQDVPLILPKDLPSGSAVFRWDQYALHQVANNPGFIEWFTQCADVRISSPSTRSWESFNSFSIIDNSGIPAYPSDVSRYRSPYKPGQAAPSDSGFFMTGPACVDDSINQCGLTAKGSKGYTGFGGDGTAPFQVPSLLPTPRPMLDLTPRTPSSPYSGSPTPSPGSGVPSAQDDGECCYATGCSSYGTVSCNPVGTWCSQSSENCQTCGGTYCTEMDWWTSQPIVHEGPEPEPKVDRAPAPMPRLARESQCCYAGGCAVYGTSSCNAADSWCSESYGNCDRCGGTLCSGLLLLAHTGAHKRRFLRKGRHLGVSLMQTGRMGRRPRRKHVEEDEF